MIHTAIQLKALVRNRSGGDSMKAQIIIRNYMMERFLERLSQSKYRDNFILKGGALISAMLGSELRSTMDLDTTIRGLPLSVEDISDIISKVLAVHMEDGVHFRIERVSEIMDEAEYPGVRVVMEAKLENMRTPLKLDISTGDAITPKEITYPFRLMFEDRTISILAYNLETTFSEKLETVLSYGLVNTRMRDFYDLCVLQRDSTFTFDAGHLKAAFAATCEKRNASFSREDARSILREIRLDSDMKHLWRQYQKKFSYAAGLTWDTVMDSVESLYLSAASE